jgi:hypothetical protein
MSLRALLLPILLLASALVASAASKPKPEKSAKTDDGFKPFAVITQRNVFNANRGLAGSTPAAATPKPPKPAVVEAFALLGTLLSERGAVAFFDGTSTGYRKAAHEGDKLGPYTLTSIEPDRVTLHQGDREVSLPVKMQCHREGQGAWQVAPLPDDYQPSPAPPPSLTVLAKPDYRTATPEQIRDYVASKYQRKLESVAKDPEKADLLLKSINREIEGRVRKLEKSRPE